MHNSLIINKERGNPYPLGTSFLNQSINFALTSFSAHSVNLCLFDRETKDLITEIPLSIQQNKTGSVWHVALKNDLSSVLYAYRINEEIFFKQNYLLDPYAKAVSTSIIWGDDKTPYQPLGEIIIESDFDWEEDKSPSIPIENLVVYEMHVRGFTKDPSSAVLHPGTFLGMIEKIPHLVTLGINAVELLPIHEFNEREYTFLEPIEKTRLFNYWGYSTVNFFSLMNRYASSSAKGSAINDFKRLVKELHKNNIEVILDVVFNHTAEGGENGPTLSYKGIDKAEYYLLDDKGHFKNYSGCGNTMNANVPLTLELIVNSLRYYVAEMHVDGFRFDLASALTRGTNGDPLILWPLIEALSKDSLLSNVKLIAEPWDAAGLYQVGQFAFNASFSGNDRWLEWNGKYRDTIRRFIKKTAWSSGEFATRFCGSEDLYPHLSPLASLNFVTCHDGFTLADLVSYNQKHNLPNGEENKDGTNDNESWNCGTEGVTTNKKILSLRDRQMKNMHLALLLSKGVPMLSMGDEYGHSKKGNNNTWCQDNELNWFLWDKLKEHSPFYRFYRLTILLRKRFKILYNKEFLRDKDVDWHGLEAFKPEWNKNIQLVALTLKDNINNENLYLAFNATDHAQTLHLPPPIYLKNWKWLVNTGSESPSDIYEEREEIYLTEKFYRIAPFSAIVLLS